MTNAHSQNGLEYAGQFSRMIYNSVGAAKGGIFLWGRAFQSYTKRQRETCTHRRAFLRAPTYECRPEKDKTLENCVHLCIHALAPCLPLVPPPFALLHQFPVRTVYISCYIQSMNTRSQQVWTQLLNIQHRIPSCSFTFSHVAFPLPPEIFFFPLLLLLFSLPPLSSSPLPTTPPPLLPLLSVLHFH